MKTIGFVGDSGSGKTTLIERLIERFARGGHRVSAIKHAHHGFDIDRPGKDSYRFRSAGAAQVLIASDRRWALLSDSPPGDDGGPEALARQLARLEPCDIVFVEGFRGQAGVDYIEVRRARPEQAAAAPAPARAAGAGLIAIATDQPERAGAGPGMALLDLNDVEAVARFVASRLGVPL
jgi:molybdopterin-guanine dinucleotide biosynthesis protein B